MKVIQMYKSENGKIFETEVEAVLEDLKEDLLSPTVEDTPINQNIPNSNKIRVITEDIIKVMKWVYEESEFLKPYLSLVFQKTFPPEDKF